MLEIISELLTNNPVLLQENNVAFPPKAAAALGVGLAALGAGIAERGIGAAAVGAIAEDRDFFGIGLVMTVLPETLVILALVVIFLVWKGELLIMSLEIVVEDIEALNFDFLEETDEQQKDWRLQTEERKCEIL